MTGSKDKAIFKIQQEHRSISAILSGLRELARAAHNSAVKPDFRVLNAMVHYIDAYPEKLHHPKEEESLFKPLLARAPFTSLIIAELRGQHAKGERLIRELQRAVAAFEVEWPAGAFEFASAADDYSDFHWAHMRKEEQELLPLCERYFTEGDWHAAAKAFAANDDALADLKERDFARLFTRIVNLAPAPVGLGKPWKGSAA